MNIGFVAGVIPRGRIAAFERILWRTLRGNLYMNQSEIPKPIIDPTNNEEIHKNVFVIFAHGKEIIAKIRKISESLGADLYSVDENSDLRREQIHEVNTRLSDLASVLRNTKNTLDAELTQIARSLIAWMIIIKKEKESTRHSIAARTIRQGKLWLRRPGVRRIRYLLLNQLYKMSMIGQACLSQRSLIKSRLRKRRQPTT